MTITSPPTLSPRSTGQPVPARAGVLRRILAPVADAQSYRNLAYLLLGLPLGTIGFSLVVTGLSVGIGLLFAALLGIPVLIGCWYGIRGLCNAERSIANSLLEGDHIDHPYSAAPSGNLWRRFVTMTDDRDRRRELGYTMLRFPVGIATFVGAVAAMAVPFTVAYAPFYLWRNPDPDWGEWTMDGTVESIASSRPLSWLLVPLAALLAIGALHLTNAMARATGRWTRSWLTPLDTAAAPEVRAAVAPAARVGTPADRPAGAPASGAIHRLHVAVFGAVLALLAFMDLVDGGGMWVHWVAITWGSVVGLHTVLAANSDIWQRSRSDAALWTHVTTFGAVNAMLLLVDVASGGGVWFYWPLITWGAIVATHAALARRTRTP